MVLRTFRLQTSVIMNRLPSGFRKTRQKSEFLFSIFYACWGSDGNWLVSLLSARKFLFRFKPKQVIVLLFSSYNKLLGFEPKNKLVGRK